MKAFLECIDCWRRKNDNPENLTLLTRRNILQIPSLHQLVTDYACAKCNAFTYLTTQLHIPLEI